MLNQTSHAASNTLGLRATDAPNNIYTTAFSEREITLKISKIINKDDKIFTMGSSFSEDVRDFLQESGFTCVPHYNRIQFDRARISIDTLPDRQHINFYNTFTILQQLEQIIGTWKQSKNDFWAPKKVSKRSVSWDDRPVYQDPYKHRVFGKTPEDLHSALELINDEMRSSFEEATAFIFTFSTTEVFRNKLNGNIVAQYPSHDSRTSSDETVHYQSTVIENIENLRSMVRLIRERKPNAPIFLTVSPVPLERTFGTSDIIVANCEGKSILRAAVGQVTNEFDNVFYVPFFEYASMMGLEAYKEDGRNLRRKVVEKTVRAFAQAHLVTDEAPDTSPESVPATQDSPFQHWNDKTRWPVARIDNPEVVYDLDGDFHQLYDEALVATGMPERLMRRQRHYLIAKLLPYIRDVPGDMAEIGCFRGLSAFLASRIALKNGIRRQFHIFDSFEGLSEPSSNDASVYNVSTPGMPNPFACSEEQVRENLKEFSFLKFYKGWVPERFHEVADRQFSYVHVDVDLFDPTKACLEFYWPRLSPGGILIMDDYGTLFYPGARQAADKFFQKRSDVVIVEVPSGGAAAIKVGKQAEPLLSRLRKLWR